VARVESLTLRELLLDHPPEIEISNAGMGVNMVRCPTILEAQAADKHLWRILCDLIMERNWSMDDSAVAYCAASPPYEDSQLPSYGFPPVSPQPQQ
ncbi:unnamed protein product, partial [Effrenium voratum]